LAKWLTILFFTASGSKIGRPSGPTAGTEVLVTGTFAFEQMSSSVAPAGQASPSGKIRNTVQNAEREARQMARCVKQNEPGQRIGGQIAHGAADRGVYRQAAGAIARGKAMALTSESFRKMRK
jgi:hypothetical protein